MDARGRIVPLLDVRAALGSENDPKGRKSEALDAARRSLRRSVTRDGWICLVMNLLIAAGLGTWAIHGLLTFPDKDRWEWAMLLFMLAFAIGAIPFSWAQLRWTHNESIAKGYVASGCCASCGYSIRGIAPEVGGCTVCPECGSAWRVDTASPSP
jgi:hypothetical protein